MGKEKEARKFSKKKIIILSIVLAISCYVLITLGITLADLIGMTTQNKRSRNVEIGTEVYQEALKLGAEEYYPLYTEEEIAKNSDLEVAKLYYIPSAKTEKTDYVLVVPGGGYFECDISKVALPSAAKVHEAGYTAFVLGYRYGKYSSKYAPMQDIAKAVKYITDHAEEFNVNPEGYSVIGFSAGGNLVGLYGTKEQGYAEYELPKPKSLTLVYPWSNINDKAQVTGNMWQDLITAVGKTIANNIVLDSVAPKKEDRRTLCVQNYVDGDYPPTYIITGDNDMVVNHERNSLILAESLKNAGVEYELEIAKGLNHGFGLGANTVADGWVERALDFWQAQP